MLEASIKKHQTVIDDFKRGIKEMLESKGIGSQEGTDLSQQGFNNEVALNADRLADQLRFANEEMKILYDMLPACGSIHSQVQLGSVVVTDKGTFFISASIERFEVGGLKVFGLSAKSPLFKAMQGKRKGDTFTYNGMQTYRIKEVF